MPARDHHRPAPPRRGLRAWIARFLGDERAAVSPILVLSLVPIVGALGVGVEASNWWLTQRSLQNAADTAVIAAATNGGVTCSGTCTSSSYVSGCTTHPGYYDCEAVAAANGEGLANGTANIAVYPQYLTSGCPASLSACYKVTIKKAVPIHLLGLVGYRGTSGSQIITAAAVGGLKLATTPDCILSLATGGTGITFNGGPNVNLAGCSIQSNSSATGGPGNNYAGNCNGHNTGADFFSSPGSPGGDNGCANAIGAQHGVVADPYGPLDNGANIPSDSCGGSYPQESNGGGSSSTKSLPASNLLSWNGSSGSATSYTWGANKVFCGDVRLMANTTISSGSTIAIYNGMLDQNGFSFKADAGSTIIFVGSSGVTSSHIISNGGTLDIAAPQSGTWSGIAIYQAPCLAGFSYPCATTSQQMKSGVDFTLAGNSPTYITGVVYLPYSNVTWSGLINPSNTGAGLKCFVLVNYTLTLNGSGGIFQNSQSGCRAAGVTQVFGGAYTHVLYQ